MAPKVLALVHAKTPMSRVPKYAAAALPSIEAAVVVVLAVSLPSAQAVAAEMAVVVMAAAGRCQQCLALTPEQLLDQCCAAVQP